MKRLTVLPVCLLAACTMNVYTESQDKHAIIKTHRPVRHKEPPGLAIRELSASELQRLHDEYEIMYDKLRQ